MNWDYLAGFTDGEGYIGLVGRGMRITWGQKDEAMLLAIKHFLESEGLKPTFYVIPAKLPHRPNPICMMNLNSRDDVVKALTELEPRLILKAQKCREVLQWIMIIPQNVILRF